MLPDMDMDMQINYICSNLEEWDKKTMHIFMITLGCGELEINKAIIHSQEKSYFSTC